MILPEELIYAIESDALPNKPSDKFIVNPFRSKIDCWVAKIHAEQQRKELDKEGLRIS
ncbi:hypothetical protein NF27_EF00040 [Candidatus Jidaibacter acanthamoeba]|uniref:Uncharacterized protein n=1 Tax=Candidatus Jidaibacter acanthamoebae TaxID=86105 RepID=A0A0C1QME0_9RICK|nr:hypothetical protein [Candidatus Jidaibacter acanthamoeba]KIE05203.1 hypothetical protein NF27_EF00040 [Candidatus Jidaibacter acanthamoeba]